MLYYYFTNSSMGTKIFQKVTGYVGEDTSVALMSSESSYQLSRKHNQVESVLLQQVFGRIVKRIFATNQAPIHRHAFKIIDSSTVALCLQKYK